MTDNDGAIQGTNTFVQSSYAVLQAKDLPDLENILSVNAIAGVTVYLAFSDLNGGSATMSEETVMAILAAGDRYGKPVNVGFLIDGAIPAWL